MHNPWIGWLLVGALGVLSWRAYGPVEGIALTVTATVFWLLLQFGSAARAMKKAAQRPMGQVPSAVMLNARLRAGQTLLQTIRQTGSLGAPLAGDDNWAWSDAGGARVELAFVRGKLARWSLVRPESQGDAEAGTAPP
jgi:hypothetical protein